MGTKQIWAILKFTLLEVWRTRLWLFAMLVIFVVGALAEFVASLAITESHEYRFIAYASIGRFVSVLLITLLVVNSVLRDFDDRVFDLVVSRAVSKSQWYLGKLLGYATIGVVLAVAISLPLIFWHANSLILWVTSLSCELIIVAAAALGFAVTLRNNTIAILLVLAFYFLSRTIGALLMMSGGAAADLARPVNVVIDNAITGLAYLLPDLERFTMSSWLLQTQPLSELPQLLVQTGIYSMFLMLIGLFDLYRRNL